MSCAVNADFARMNTPLRDGDEVAFLPPVSGGDYTDLCEITQRQSSADYADYADLVWIVESAHLL